MLVHSLPKYGKSVGIIKIPIFGKIDKIYTFVCKLGTYGPRILTQEQLEITQCNKLNPTPLKKNHFPFITLF